MDGIVGNAGHAGVILAGGNSSRMGANKAEMIFAGEPLLQRVLLRLSVAVDDVVVIGPQTLASVVPLAHVISDLLPAVGPLGGLYTALKATACARVFLLACDMPFAQPGLMRAMLALSEANTSADAVVLQAGQRVQPLHAVYQRTCLPAIEKALASDDHSMQSLLAQLSTIFVEPEIVSREDPHGISSFNVNTPANWENALRLAAELESSQGASGDQ